MRLALSYPASALSALASLIAAYPAPAQNLNDPTLKAEVIRLIHSQYFRQVTIDTSLPVDQMIASLDPHSSYEPKVVAEKHIQRLSEPPVSFGLWAARNEGKCLVSYVEQYDCAEKAGVLNGDEIIEIGGHRIDDMTDSEIFALLHDRGEWAFELRVYRKSADTTLRFWITRNDATQFTRVYNFGMIDDSTGYVRLDDFGAGTVNQLRWALDTLAQRGMKSLLLDLRDKPGGIVDEAVGVEDLFVSGRTRLAMMRSVVPFEEDTFYAHAPSPYESLPLMVLVNRNSWSAAELLAGSLQDLDRATIVGEATGGKALVMRYLPLTNGDQVYLAVAGLVLPSGRCTQSIYHDGLYDFDPPVLPAGFNTHHYDALYTQMPCRNFTTAHGRTVSWHEGIIPDIIMADATAFPPDWYFNTLDTFAIRLLRDSITYYRTQTLPEWMASDHFGPDAIANLEATLEVQDTSHTKHIAYSFEPMLQRFLAARIADRIWYSDGWMRHILVRSPIVRRALLEPRHPSYTSPR
jgi:carboxyl-terminal processing protease